MISETITRLRKQTIEDYRVLPEGTRAQLIDGEIVMSPAPTSEHQRIVSSLTRVMGNHSVEHTSGEVLTAPLDVHLSETFVVQADVLFVTEERRHVIETDGLHGAPDLAIEVLSPSTAYFDLVTKREAYERFGVREYWIVDPERRTVEILLLDEEGYESRQKLTDEGTARSVLLDGFEIELDELFEMRP